MYDENAYFPVAPCIDYTPGADGKVPHQAYQKALSYMSILEQRAKEPTMKKAVQRQAVNLLRSLPAMDTDTAFFAIICKSMKILE